MLGLLGVGTFGKRLTTPATAVFSLVLLASCADYDFVGGSPTFEREAARISDNLARPAPQIPGLKDPGTPTARAGTPAPYIIGQTGNEELLRGVPTTPVDVDLRFEDAEISEVVTTILGDILKRPYVLDTNLKGRVSFRTTRGITQRDLVNTLREAVNRVGGDIRRAGATFEVQASGRLDDQRIAQLRAQNTSVTIVPLRFARASTVNDLLKAIYPGAAGQIAVDDQRNLLIISGAVGQRTQMGQTAELFDVDGLGGKTVAVFPLGSGDAKNVSEELKKIYESTAQGRNEPVEFIPMQRLNAVLVIARNQAMMPRVQQLVAGLDRKRVTNARTMYVIQLQHAKAATLAGVLRESLGLEGGRADASQPPQPQQTPRGPGMGPMGPGSGPGSGAQGPGAQGPGGAGAGPMFAPAAAAPPPSNTAGPVSGMPPAPQDPQNWDLENVPLRIVANADTNSLVIFATPAEIGLLQEAIRRLDAMPLQVLIEATIMDVVLNDQLQFGVQAFLRSVTDQGNIIQTGVTATNLATMGPTSSGFNFIFTAAGQVQAAVNALRSVTRVNVLSSPQLVTLDNQRATLEVGSQVPITTQTLTQATGGLAPAVVNSVSYVQTGVILYVTPRVNSTGGVDLEIRQEVTDAPTVDPNNPSLTPVLTRRVIETRVSVQSTQTIALGGLILEARSDGRNRVPLLGDIPIIGWLFGQTNIRRSKEELLVFLTPTVFTNPDEARNFSLELRRRIDSLWRRDGTRPPQ
jgi:general secretion pathway protein D